VQNVADRYVFSYKPNPAVFATDDWHPEEARRELVAVLERARGGHVEFIMKDISTVRYQPRRLWDWARLAMEVVEEQAR
jgi:predicted alpha/beta-fold hydrolase